MSQVIWISHRGYCQNAVENTQKSFDAALEQGFRHLETDLRSTADGEIILQHNATLDKTCGVANHVETSRWTDLKKIKTTDGQSLLTLTDLYRLYHPYKWILDIKKPGDKRTLDLLVDWVRIHNAQAWVETNVRFLLWSRGTARHCEKLFPRVMTMAQEKECYQAGLAVLLGLTRLGGLKKGRTYSIPPRFGKFRLFNSRTVEAYHAQGAWVLAYLPDREDDAKIAHSLGFDEILTNGRKLF
ncbi:MAG: hypothetical protein H7249_18390 [Chitinophagaceae bacterium]|nr:hypothetical protein [Oligoflexus sp.]